MAVTGSIPRRATRQVRMANVCIGGGARVVPQSMTNTDTADVAATVAQVKALGERTIASKAES